MKSLLHSSNTELDSQSLYRRYRPQVFTDVVGQEHVTHTLRNALKSRPPRVSHAYLFCGPRGTGKTTTARLLAKGLNCETGPTPDPCCQCDMCQRIARGSAMDVLEIDAASNTGVDKVRDVIIEKVNYAPAEGRYRVYIIDEVHQLSSHAFNALLKTLEEPPPHVVFILATTETHKVPGTILSRCQRFDFKPISPREIVQRMQLVCATEELEIEPTALARIARAAEGSARDALSILEQASAYSDGSITELEVEAVLGTVSQELLFDLTEAIAHHDTSRAIMLVHEAVNRGKDVQQLLLSMGGHLRDLLLLNLDCTVDELAVVPTEIIERMKIQAKQIGRRRLGSAISVVCEAEKEMRANSQHRLITELTLFKLADSSAESPSDAQPSPEEPRPAPFSPPEPLRPRLLSPTKPSSGPATSTRKDEQATGSGSKPRSDEAGQEALMEEGTPLTVASEKAGEKAAPARTGEVVPTDVQTVRELWKKVLSKARKHGASLPAVLMDATPVSLANDTVVLEFANQFHHDHVAEVSKRKLVGEIVSEVLGHPVGIRCTLRVGKKGRDESPVRREDISTAVAEGVAGGESPSTEESEDLVQAAMSLFDATVVAEKRKE